MNHTSYPCPDCGSVTTINLRPSRMVTKATHPELIGSRNTYEVITPRTLTWDCTNKECDQSEGKPTIKGWWARQRKSADDELEQKLAEIDYKEHLDDLRKQLQNGDG